MEDGGVEKAFLDDIQPAEVIDTELQTEDVDKKKLVLQKNSRTLKSFSTFEEEINNAKDSQQKNTDDEEKETKKAEKKDRKLNVVTPGQPKVGNVDTWTQGPENANQIHTQRKFNIKTPGQVRDYAKFVYFFFKCRKRWTMIILRHINLHLVMLTLKLNQVDIQRNLRECLVMMSKKKSKISKHGQS